mmetsp:Transcript_10673/g.21962  ORF Transcript_10673/g.21962 Transcript_10673/m.21962 type:complete len:365 (+) Transcript_10673:176-1270(+)|eukprot:CAMPEP_0118636950 /NCGR_PEP_ID=MMETSP0785-20121206/2899_1 /TAXON_ID=91992 /ORGANISM="Bolidomonas pacifica, Strain CCMP 1866" /LENGTH=364 /DNA_ID=CAMNT_0006528117 /DNA_START=123 /DNA_END=1217 /DNA_ORIENTATION=-
MNCRLNEISLYREDSEGSPSSGTVDLESGSKERELRTPLMEGGGSDGMSNSSREFMQEFFETVDEVKSDIHFLAKSTAQINVIKEQTTRLSVEIRGRPGSGKLATLVMDANKAAVRSKKILQELRRQVSDIELALTGQESDKGKSSTTSNNNKKKKKQKKKGNNQNIDPKLARTIRVRKNVVQALTRKFIETMKEYQSAQQSYKSNMEENTLRQVQIVSPDVTREDLQGIIRQQGEGAAEAVAAIATKSLLKSKVNGEESIVGSKIKNSLRAVESRYNEVVFLEASIRELAAMFEEFAVMVEEQSELLDNIEFQTKSARTFIEDGIMDTQEAIELNRKLRKKRCCLLMIVVVVIVFGFFVFKIF